MILTGVMSVSAKKIKVTIDGKTYPNQSRLYMIVNEDTANAQLIPIQNGQFSVTLKVDNNAFIRLHEYKEWPERSVFVLIPDSKHITIDWNTGNITGSEKSNQLSVVTHFIRDLDADNFHIDVFSDRKEDWDRAREKGQMIRNQMQMKQRDVIVESMRENVDNDIPAWLYFCYHNRIEDIPIEAMTIGKNPKWLHHKVMDVLRSRK